jgi:hypothetical protein
MRGPEVAASFCIRCARSELSRKQGARLGARRRGAVAALFWCYGALAERRHAPSARWGAVALLCACAPCELQRSHFPVGVKEPLRQTCRRSAQSAEQL